MTKLYYNMIKRGTISIDDVPTKWRKQVQALLK